MAFTFITVNSTPADNGSNSLDNINISTGSGANVNTGDLIIIYATKRNATGTISLSSFPGTLNSETVHVSSTATLTGRLFWGKYDGSAGSSVSNLSVGQLSFSATTNNTAVILVFRPTTSNKTISKDGNGTNTLSSFSAAATITNNGVTPANASNLSLAIWSTDDDNTWGSLSGTNWVQTSLGAQYRNTAGSDTSMAFAYQIQTSAAATNNVSLTEATLGNDPGIKGMFTFYESAAAYTLTVDAGSYSNTGNSISLLRGLKVITTAGSYSTTGNTSTLSKGYKVITSAGSYATSGNSITQVRTYILSNSAGTYSTTGNSATLARGLLLTTSAGSYAETGNSINLFKGWKTITTAGSYLLVGSSANTLWNHNLSTTAGVYSETGNSVGLIKTWQLPTVAGVYSYTGNSVNLSHGSGETLIASTGNYLITGSDVGLTWNRILTPQVGSYTETGNDATLLANRILQATDGTYVIAGNSVTFTQGALATYRLSPKKGGYKVAGRSAILRDVNPGPGLISVKKAYPRFPNKNFNKWT